MFGGVLGEENKWLLLTEGEKMVFKSSENTMKKKNPPKFRPSKDLRKKVK